MSLNIVEIVLGLDGGRAVRCELLPDTVNVVSAKDLDSNMGAFTVTFGSPGKGGDAFDWGVLPPGLYEIAMIQGLLRIVKFINVPYYSAQSAK